MKKRLTSLLPLLVTLVMIGGCERVVQDSEGSKNQPEEELIRGQATDIAIKSTAERSSPFEENLSSDRFAEIDQSQAAPIQSVVAEYHDPGYFIPVKETAIVLGQQDISEENGHVYGSRESGIPLTTEYQRFRLDEDCYFIIAFDNDIFSNTDYYYTNGLTFELFHPYLSSLPTRHLLPRAGRGSANSYSVCLTQTLYTPIDPDKTQVQVGDRPFASYMVLGIGNISNNPDHHTRITSRLDLGVIGPAALGGTVQKTIHNIEPVGWQNQISNDFVLNYFIQLEKGIPLSNSVMVSGRLAGQAGTLRSNLSAGTSLYISNAAGYYESVFLRSADAAKKNRLNYYLLVSADATLVGYDATLQGGVTNPGQDIYVIAAADIDRLVFHGSVGAGLNFRWFSLEAEHVYLTPEFATGKSHMWTRLKTVFKL